MKSLVDLLSITCPECGDSDGIVWNSSVKTPFGVQDGRLASHDITPIFYAGCMHCSETVETINGDDLALALTDALLSQLQEEKG